MMGDDWRTFRAKLVAYEKAEAECMNESMKSQLPKDSDDNDDDGKKFTQFISKGLSSIFTSGSPNKIPKQHHATSNVNIEDQNHEFISPSLPLNQEEGEFRDPFASVDEVFALNSDFDLITQHISLDKHHWAHPISHIEPGCVLLANEKLGGEFRQTVVLIADHHDTIGSSGLVINRPMKGSLLKVAGEKGFEINLGVKLAFNCARTGFGGPVMQEDHSILHSFGRVKGASEVCPGVYIGGSDELMNAVRQNEFDPHNALFLKGHCAWAPKQLQKEIDKGIWYVASVSPDFILRYAQRSNNNESSRGSSQEELWHDIMDFMGGKFADICRSKKTGEEKVWE